MSRLLAGLSLVALSCLLSLHLKATPVISRSPVRAFDGAEFFFTPIPTTGDIVTDPEPALPGTNKSTQVLMAWTLGSENVADKTEIQRRTIYQTSIPPVAEESTLPPPFSSPPDIEDDYNIGIIFDTDIEKSLKPCPTHVLETTDEDLSQQSESIDTKPPTIIITSSEGYLSTEFSYQPRQVPVSGDSSVAGCASESSSFEFTDISSCSLAHDSIPTTVSSTITGSPDHNMATLAPGKGLKIAVCVCQESGMVMSKDYYNIAAGIRGLEILQKEFPEAEFTFVVEHFSKDESEWQEINTLTSIPGVATFFLKGKHDKYEIIQELSSELEKSHNFYAEQAVRLADFIFHAPGELISAVSRHKAEYAEKVLKVLEYTNQLDEDDTTDHKSGSIYGRCTGFPSYRLYLNDRKPRGTRFKAEILEKHDVISGSHALYFANSYNDITQCMLNILLIIESASVRNSVRDVVLVTSFPGSDQARLVGKIQAAAAIQTTDMSDRALTNGRSNIEAAMIAIRNKLRDLCRFKKVRIVYDDPMGTEQEIILFENPRGESVKTIRYIYAFPLDEHDLLLLQKYAVINSVSGDIPMSDVLALGKIPLIDPMQDRSNSDRLLCKLNEFSADNGHRTALVISWRQALTSFSIEFNQKLSRAPEKILQSIQLLGSHQWHDFEKEFTDRLKTNTNIAPFIIQTAKDVITKKKQSGALPESEDQQETSL